MNTDFIINIIDDLTYYPESYLNDHNSILFGSKTADKYIKIPLALKPLTDDILNNKNSLSLKYSELISKYSNIYDEKDILNFVLLLHSKNLIRIDANVFKNISHQQLINKDEFFENSKTIFKINLKHGFLKPSQAKVTVITFNIFLILSLIISLYLFFTNTLSSGLDFYKHFFYKIHLNSFIYWLQLFIIAIFSFIAHEFGHIITANQYEIYTSSIDYKSYMIFQNYLSVKLPGLHTLPLRKKIKVTIAGPKTNLLIMLFSFIFLHFYYSNLMINIFVINFFMFITNLNPFYDTDGFHFISNYFFKSNDIKNDSLNKLKYKKKLYIKNIIFILSYFITRSILIIFGIIVIHVIFDIFLNKYINIFSIRTSLEIFTVFIYLFFQIKTIVKYFK